MKVNSKIFILCLILLCFFTSSSTVFGETKERSDIKNIKKEIVRLENTNSREKNNEVFKQYNKILQCVETLEEQRIETIPEIPLYNQLAYPNTSYGNYGTVASHGCGITCVAMVTSYLTDEEVKPDKLAKEFGSYNTPVGSCWTLFKNAADEYGIKVVKETYNRDEIIKALKNGQPVISSQRSGLFTNGGHFIVLTGITKDGKITVNDPNWDNYTKNETMMWGFKDGFTKDQIFSNSVQCWIYQKKNLNN